jgi:hypothetical protein
MKNIKMEIRHATNKKKKYGSYVKEVYWPKISEKKKNEMKHNIENIFHKSPALEKLAKS